MSEENLFIQSSEHAYLGFRWFELCSLCRRLGGRWNNRKLHKRYKDAISSVWHWKIKRTQWTKRWEHPWQVGNFYDFGDRVGGRRMMGRKSAKTTTVVASCIHCRWFLPAASSRSPPPHPPPPPRFSISSLPSNTSCLLGKRQRANFFYCCMRFLCLGSLRFSLGFSFFVFLVCAADWTVSPFLHLTFLVLLQLVHVACGCGVCCMLPPARQLHLPSVRDGIAALEHRFAICRLIIYFMFGCPTARAVQFNWIGCYSNSSAGAKVSARSLLNAN